MINTDIAMKRKRERTFKTRRAFTLLELLVVIGVIGILLGLLLPSLAQARNSSRSAACQSQLRQIVAATLLYAQENNDQFPRTQHTASAFRQLPWGRAIVPVMCPCPCGMSALSWDRVFNGLYRCPVDKRRDKWSYGMNVYYELGSNDDYMGSPATWRRTADVASPAAAILFAELNNSVDHVMAHFWEPGCPVEVDTLRHGYSSNYAYVDGHAGTMEFIETYNPKNHRDRWNPGLAN